MKIKGIDVRKFTAADLDPKPECYQNEIDGYAGLVTFTSYAMLFPNGVDEKPIYFMRNSNADSFRWMGVINLGDGPLDYQTSAHHEDLAQADARVSPYQKVSDDPVAYEIKSDYPYSYRRYSEEGCIWKEGENGSVFDLKYEPLPYAIFEHKDSPRRGLFWLQGAIVSGTYEGKPVAGMGGFDFTYLEDGGDHIKHDNTLAYVVSLLLSVREDGRREIAYACIPVEPGGNGNGEAYYFIDGEEPIVTNEVCLEADWRRLPYLLEGDHTVVMVDGVWKFGGKEFHVNGKWGAKGFTAKPRLERIGQSQCFGTWYEGKEPYKQKMYHVITESMSASEENITKMGFKVI